MGKLVGHTTERRLDEHEEYKGDSVADDGDEGKRRQDTVSAVRLLEEGDVVESVHDDHMDEIGPVRQLGQDAPDRSRQERAFFRLAEDAHRDEAGDRRREHGSEDRRVHGVVEGVALIGVPIFG